MAMGTFPIRTVVYLWMQGILDFDENFYSCITATLTLFLSSTTPSSISFLPIPLALSCRTCGGEGGSGVDCWVFEAEQWSQVKSLFPPYCATFKSPEHFACTHPELLDR